MAWLFSHEGEEMSHSLEAGGDEACRERFKAGVSAVGPSKRAVTKSAIGNTIGRHK